MRRGRLKVIEIAEGSRERTGEQGNGKRLKDDGESEV